MKKTSRKVALFSTVVTFEDNGTRFTPDEAEVTEMMLSLLEDMIKTVKNTTRVRWRLEYYVKMRIPED